MHRDITSKTNERIRRIAALSQRKVREREKLFIVEGIRGVEEAVTTPYLQETYYSDKLTSTPRGQALLQTITENAIPLYHCNDQVFATLSDTINSQGVIGVATQPQLSLAAKSGLLLILDEIQDPGNLGTLIRTGVGAGVDGFYLTRGTVDPYNPKVVRATMGALLKAPIVQGSAEDCLSWCQSQGLTVIIADLVDAIPYYQADLTQNMALVIGNEGRGISRLFQEAATLRVTIPLTPMVESLNASVAAGILVYEAIRQRIVLK